MIGLVLTLNGCATQPRVEKIAPVFYPALPNSPRIQYLTTISTANDQANQDNAFARFVLGEKEKLTSIAKKPYGLAFSKGKIYLVDSQGPGYVVYDLVKQSYVFITGQGGGRMKKPINLSIDKNNHKYVTDTGRNQVLVFDEHDQFIKAFGEEGQFKPGDAIAVDQRLFVTDLKNHQIHVLDINSGKTLLTFGHVGSEPGQFFYPTNVTISKQQLYITDTGNYRVQVFNLDGEFIKSFGSIGSGPGQFARPKGLSVDANERLYVVDAAFENVQILDSAGKLLLFFGQPGNNSDNINLPTDIVIDYENVNYFSQYARDGFDIEYVIAIVSQFGNNKVNVYGYGKMKGKSYPN